MLKLDEPFKNKKKIESLTVFQQFRFGFQDQNIFNCGFCLIFCPSDTNPHNITESDPESQNVAESDPDP